MFLNEEFFLNVFIVKMNYKASLLRTGSCTALTAEFCFFVSLISHYLKKAIFYTWCDECRILRVRIVMHLEYIFFPPTLTSFSVTFHYFLYYSNFKNNKYFNIVHYPQFTKSIWTKGNFFQHEKNCSILNLPLSSILSCQRTQNNRSKAFLIRVKSN